MVSKPSRNLAGKVAIVTGSSRGIGAAIVLALAERGANVVINYFSSEAAAVSVAAKAKEHGSRAIMVKADVRSHAAVGQLFESARSEFGRVDIVVSNSGVEHFGDLESVTEEELDATLGLNVKAQFFVAQHAHKYLAEGGRLMLMSSISAHLGIPRHAVYAASKAAVEGMVKCLAWDFGRKKITVNAIAPGGVKTDMYAESAREYMAGQEKELTEEEIDKNISSWSPLGRPGFPDDVAGVVVLLASEESGWLTGEVFRVSGGA